MHVLIVEDDAQLGRGLEVAIKRWGDTSEWVRDGVEALSVAKTVPFDLVVLDLGLPRLTGIDVLKSLKRDGVSVAVIIITARDALDDRINGLDLGADDYLIKPFALEELAARMRSVRRRVTKTDTSNIEVGRLALDTRSREARFDGAVLALSRRGRTSTVSPMRRSRPIVSKAMLPAFSKVPSAPSGRRSSAFIRAMTSLMANGLIR